MEIVTLSANFEIVIPRDVREQLGLTPGQRFQVFICDDRIQLIPVRPIAEYRGILKGIDPNIEREDDRLL